MGNVNGLKAVLAGLRKHRKAKAAGLQRGLKQAGLFIQAEAQIRTPVDTGNLKASAGTRADGRGFETVVSVFYRAAYALFVHEMGGKRDKRPRQGPANRPIQGPKRRRAERGKGPKRRKSTVGGPKFLENAIKENRSRISEIIEENLRT